MKYRVMGAMLRRFIKASDDLRTNPSGPKGVENNKNKVEFMRAQIAAILDIERQFSK